MFRLGSGEALARVCGIATLLFLARRFGVVIVGVYALGQTMAQYSLPFIDFGLRHVGARLVAQYPHATQQVVHGVQRRRIRMAFLLLPLLIGYAASTMLPWNFRACLLAFAATCTLHSLSLDWLAWGKERLGLIGVSRGLIPLCVLIFALAGRNSGDVLWWVVVGHFIGVCLHVVVLWSWWKRQQHSESRVEELAEICESLAWRRTSILGFATLCNLAFNSIDMLMLGVISTPQQLGLYSASYRIINQVLYTYYLLTQVLYPQLARQSGQQRQRMIGLRVMLSLAGMGTAIAVLVVVVRRPLVNVLFGPRFLAPCLLLLLAWAIPFDFLTSYLNNAYLAWGMEKKLLVCTAVAAVSNAFLNFFWIPRYGATAAAANTLISYVIYLVCLVSVAHRVPEGAALPRTTEIVS